MRELTTIIKDDGSKPFRILVLLQWADRFLIILSAVMMLAAIRNNSGFDFCFFYACGAWAFKRHMDHQQEYLGAKITLLCRAHKKNRDMGR